MRQKRGVEYTNFCVHVPDIEVANWIKSEAERQRRPYGNFLLCIIRERMEAEKQEQGQAEDGFVARQTA